MTRSILALAPLMLGLLLAAGPVGSLAQEDSGVTRPPSRSPSRQGQISQTRAKAQQG
jgi:hypothetical protein